MDTKILEALFWRGVPVFNMRSNMRTDDVGWGTPVFHKMGREKVILINAFLSEDVEILMCDTDVVFLQVNQLFSAHIIHIMTIFSWLPALFLFGHDFLVSFEMFGCSGKESEV